MLHQPTSLSVTVSSQAPGRMPKKPGPAKVTGGVSVVVEPPPPPLGLPPFPPPPLAARRTILPFGYTAVGTGKRLPTRKRLGGRPSSFRSLSVNVVGIGAQVCIRWVASTR